MEHQRVAEESAQSPVVREEIPPIIAPVQPSKDESGGTVDEYEKSGINADESRKATTYEFSATRSACIKRRAPVSVEETVRLAPR
jgi:hypothetical protein